MSVLVAVCSAFDWSCFGSLMAGGAFIFGRNSSTCFFGTIWFCHHYHGNLLNVVVSAQKYLGRTD